MPQIFMQGRSATLRGRVSVPPVLSMMSASKAVLELIAPAINDVEVLLLFPPRFDRACL